MYKSIFILSCIFFISCLNEKEVESEDSNETKLETSNQDYDKSNENPDVELEDTAVKKESN